MGFSDVLISSSMSPIVSQSDLNAQLIFGRGERKHDHFCCSYNLFVNKQNDYENIIIHYGNNFTFLCTTWPVSCMIVSSTLQLL